MVGSDIIAMIANNGMTVTVASYKIREYQTQCVNKYMGVCPDENDTLEVSIQRVSGREVFVRLRRLLVDEKNPRSIPIKPGTFQSIIWASGIWRAGQPMYHGGNRIQAPVIVDFGDASLWTCNHFTKRTNVPLVPAVFRTTPTTKPPPPDYYPDYDEDTVILHFK